jgi:outer membrane protein W
MVQAEHAIADENRGCAGITHMRGTVTGKEQTARSGGLTVTVITTDNIRVLTPAGEIDHHTGDTTQLGGPGRRTTPMEITP